MKELHIGRFLLIVGLLFVFVAIGLVLWAFSPVQRSMAQATQAARTNANLPRQSALVSEYLAGMKKLRGGGLSSAQRQKLAGQMADVRQRLKDLRKQMRVSSGALPFGPPPSQSRKMSVNANQIGSAVERCEKCKYVFYQIEEDLGGKIETGIFQASFDQNCGNAQKDSISYEVCEDLYDDLYAITDDYMSNTRDPAIICQKANQCP